MSTKFTRSRIQEIITGAGLDVRTASELTGRIITAMTAALAAGEAIELRGFGSLEVRERAGRRMRNPRTREPVDVPPRRRVLFRPGRELKAALRGMPGSD
ncbi:MAG: HU family DNA-binding protein [Treponema sp.]|jgi:nucleoid DNA-binding protein|nr:HU family DNA-binding protein [Treponema sp.]